MHSELLSKMVVNVMVDLPDQMLVVNERLKRELDISVEVNSFAAPLKEEEGQNINYCLKFWVEALALKPSAQVKNAYFKAYLDALALDRWKIKIEKYPAWVRRTEQVRYINEHLERVMPLAQKSLHRREAIGLALARMETFDRRVAKKTRLSWAIAGESRYLGDKNWRCRLEEILPKSATYRFCYSYSNLMVKGLGKKLLSQLLTLQPTLYISKNGLWYPQKLSSFDGLIWVGKKTACPFKRENIVYCSSELTAIDRRNIGQMHKQLKNKQKRAERL